MKRLILTTNDTGAGSLRQAGLADFVIGFGPRFVWGPLPSQADLATLLEARSAKHDLIGTHWLDYLDRRLFPDISQRNLGLVEFCEQYETIELWADPRPNDQLTLVWLLDFLRPHEKIVSRLSLVQPDDVIGGFLPETIAQWSLLASKISDSHLQASSVTWHAYRAPTPQGCFNLLSTDLTRLPQLRPAIIALLEELPERATGLGATEMRMLELVSEGYINPIALFPHHPHQQRKVFEFFEAGLVLDRLGHCPEPAVSGLGEGPFPEEADNLRARHERYVRSRLALTWFGEAIMNGTEDFSRHNPIHRWWGGTGLTNDRLWRWDRANHALIAP